MPSGRDELKTPSNRKSALIPPFPKEIIHFGKFSFLTIINFQENRFGMNGAHCSGNGEKKY
jgi:hypothetical protein